MSDNKHAGRGGKGYYIALILCAAAIGITSYVSIETPTAWRKSPFRNPWGKTSS